MFCVSPNRTSCNNAIEYELVLEMFLRCFIALVICMASGSASVHLCLLFPHSHFFVLLLSQVYFNRYFSSSIDLQAWNFFSRHLRKWKYLEHSWTECPVSCKSEVAQLRPTLCDPWTVAHQLLCPWDSPGKNTGVGCHFLLQRIFLTQGSNPGLPHCRQTL